MILNCLNDGHVPIVEEPWCSGSDSRLVNRGSCVRIPLRPSVLWQGVNPQFATLHPGVKWVPGRMRKPM